MLSTQQFNNSLPEQPKGVHELRAALLSVYLRTDPQTREYASYALPPAIRPPPLEKAIERILASPPKDTKTTRSSLTQLSPEVKIAKFKLMSAVYVEGAKEFEPYLKELVSPEEVERLQHGFFARDNNGGAATRHIGPTYADVRRLVYGQDAEGAHSKDRHSDEDRRPESRLDLSTMTTTVDIPSTSTIPFEQLATALDPLSWSNLASLFWRQSDRAELDDKLGINILPTTQVGKSWDGFLFEHVEWNWNTSVVSSFKNLLKIHFDVDATQKIIKMKFCLHSCEGSQIYALASRRGVDVDYGCQTAKYLTPEKAQLTTQKNVRFSDMLNRRTPFEGEVGSGAMLLYLAPALVGLWMNYLLANQR